MADTQRYWDGQGWTSHLAPGLPAPQSPLPQAAPETPLTLIRGRSLTRVACGVLALGLIPSVVLGYSGDPDLASAGNLLFLLTLVVGVPLLLVGWVLRLTHSRT
jgi:hypothetical protein